MNISIDKDNKKILINDQEISFQNRIEKVLDFGDILVIHLMDDNIPDNNILALDQWGGVVWRVTDIIKLNDPEAYVSLSKVNNDEISVISYNGINTRIDIRSRRIIDKQIRK